MTESPHTSSFDRALRSLRVWDTELPAFDPAAAPAEPLPLFHDWFVAAADAGQVEPHTMSLATVDDGGRPDVRTVMLHGADARGWHFASHATSAKGRQLAARPEAALGFYWPVQGRQVRVRGRVSTSPRDEAYADLHARTTGALASALVGRQSEVLGSLDELRRVSEAAWERASAEPGAHAESWTVYVLEPTEVEFFQGDERRRHVRLRYRRETTGWVRELLWP
ncbi:pyridoxal 5'-phosphate synthase [Streptomyces sp. P9(2023)]|uniref:pyridoxine/pyridoxamine 5'-phosphate oxidase n=1 Tax=Streptomyces sp. P9(2023) TaxID=3064394 RepID=UPI0028F42232|nr:pyridoxal 5'-phosphate synthase [Streptomyces sp. P9(2023)]MDT9692452.1 pyridoxal 5'-phosphate synthase [Streptomyces sp. P9(2023)]